MIDLFTYWEGPRPRYIEDCLRSIRRSVHGSRVQFHNVTPDSVATYVSPGVLHENYQKLTEPAHRSDCIRAALLAEHGGFYFDADTVGLRSPEEVASNHDLVYCMWTNMPRRVLNGYIYAQPGSELARQWLASINEQLGRMDDPQAEAPWTAFGERILTPLVDAYPTKTRRVSRAVFLPVEVDREVERFFQPGDPKRFIQPDSVCFGLNHSWMWKNQREAMEMSRMDMSTSPLLIHRVLTHCTACKP